MGHKKSPSNSTQSIMKSTRESARSRTQEMLAFREIFDIADLEILDHSLNLFLLVSRERAKAGRLAGGQLPSAKPHRRPPGLCVVKVSHANPLSERMTRELMFGLRVLSRTAMTSGPVMPFS